jgi:hypothetical protein
MRPRPQTAEIRDAEDSGAAETWRELTWTDEPPPTRETDDPGIGTPASPVLGETWVAAADPATTTATPSGGSTSTRPDVSWTSACT